MMQPSSSSSHQHLLAGLSCSFRQLEVCPRAAIVPIGMVLAVFCALLMTFLSSEEALAQIPRNFRIPPSILPDVESSEAEAETLPESTAPLVEVIVDTDPGVDDAAALIWLLSQRRYDVTVLGWATVAGNTTVENATFNARLIRGWLGETNNWPVVQGASEPLPQLPSVVRSLTQSLIHGPDGLWFFLQGPPPDPPTSSHPLDTLPATDFYCGHLKPGVRVIALGPLTNIALAVNECPNKWQGVEIVSLGGSDAQGNQTPVTEYNYWQDPLGAAVVVSHTVSSEFAQPMSTTLQIVIADASTQFEIGPSDIRQLQRHGVPAIQNLLGSLAIYMEGFTAGGETPALPDPVAAIYALDNRFGTAQSARVEVMTGVPELVRGQTVIGLTPTEKIVMNGGDAKLSELAFQYYANFPNFDLNAALFEIATSRLDNAVVVTDIDARRMHNIFLHGLRDISSTGEDDADASQVNNYEHQMFVPLVID